MTETTLETLLCVFDRVVWDRGMLPDPLLLVAIHKKMKERSDEQDYVRATQYR